MRRRNPNPVTEDTRKCICWWHDLDHMTFSEIGEILDRPTVIVELIYKQCVDNGKRDNYLAITNWRKK